MERARLAKMEFPFHLFLEKFYKNQHRNDGADLEVIAFEVSEASPAFSSF